MSTPVAQSKAALPAMRKSVLGQHDARIKLLKEKKFLDYIKKALDALQAHKKFIEEHPDAMQQFVVFDNDADYLMQQSEADRVKIY